MTRRPPRLAVRMVVVTFVTAAALVAAIFGVVVYSVRNQVRKTVQEHLEASQQVVSTLHTREQRSLRLQAETLAESPTLKAAVDTYAAETAGATDEIHEQLVDTIAGELDKMAGRVDADAVIVLDSRDRTLAASGRLATEWPRGRKVMAASGDTAASDGITHTERGLFRVVSAPLLLGDGSMIGTLVLATSLDDAFARRLSDLSGTGVVIRSRSGVVATTLEAAVGADFEKAAPGLHRDEGIVDLAGESHAFRRLVSLGDTAFYALTSIDRSAEAAVAETTRTLSLIALGALSLALVASVLLAHLLSRPIGQLSSSIHDVAQSRKFSTTLPLHGSSRELDALTATFNALMTSVVAAEAETQAAYTAAIRGLAAALDARDRYTAGHSERVSTLSVDIGRVLGLPESELEVVRLGALLHDIGKIGVPDEILRKPGPLTADEYETLKEHTRLGARILGNVPFLAPHISIVELHHERPNGSGYPHGLRGTQIPLAARIVHVADAFDAMTSARAYRRERPANDALRELWRFLGTEFDTDVVQALTIAITGRAVPPPLELPEALSA